MEGMNFNEQEGIVSSSENFLGSGTQEFSHSILVMSALMRCSINGSKEMHEGFLDEKTDHLGNTTRTYVEDTQRTYISSVKVAKTIMSRDFDDEINESLKLLMEKMDAKYKSLCEEELIYWETAKPMMKKGWMDQNIYYAKGSLNKSFHFYNMFKDFEEETFRDIHEELHKLSKRLKDYKKSSADN